jgi:hypothetical protein
MGYRYEIPAEKLVPIFTADSKLALSSESIPTRVESAPIMETAFTRWTTSSAAGQEVSSSQADTGDFFGTTRT